MRFKTITFELQGTSHVKSQKPCQDKVLVKETNNVHFFGLADGAGSAKKSALGAREVLKQVSSLVLERFDKLYALDSTEIALEVADVVKCTLTKLSKQCKKEIKAFSSTLLWVATKEDKVLLAHLGDGTISFHTSNGWVIQSQPENGEFANQTYFTTHSNLASHIRVQKGTANTLGGVDGVLLASDGGTSGFAGTKLGNKKLSYSGDVIDKLYLMLQEQQEDACGQEIQNFYENYVMKEITEDDCSMVFSIVDKPKEPILSSTELICNYLYGEINEVNLYKSGKVKEAYEIMSEVGEPTELLCGINEIINAKSVVDDEDIDTLREDNISTECYDADDTAEVIIEDDFEEYDDEDPWNVPVTESKDREIEVQFEDSLEDNKTPEDSELKVPEIVDSDKAEADGVTKTSKREMFGDSDSEESLEDSVLEDSDNEESLEDDEDLKDSGEEENLEDTEDLEDDVILEESKVLPSKRETEDNVFKSVIVHKVKTETNRAIKNDLTKKVQIKEPESVETEEDLESMNEADLENLESMDEEDLETLESREETGNSEVKFFNSFQTEHSKRGVSDEFVEKDRNEFVTKDRFSDEFVARDKVKSSEDEVTKRGTLVLKAFRNFFIEDVDDTDEDGEDSNKE